MQQANIKTVQLLRTAVYSCDFGVLYATVLLLLPWTNIHIADGWLLLTAVIVCAVLTTYRLTIAFRHYLRVHLPFATVLASQVIAVLIVFIVLVQIADFSRRI